MEQLKQSHGLNLTAVNDGSMDFSRAMVSVYNHLNPCLICNHLLLFGWKFDIPRLKNKIWLSSIGSHKRSILGLVLWVTNIIRGSFTSLVGLLSGAFDGSMHVNVDHFTLCHSHSSIKKKQISNFMTTLFARIKVWDDSKNEEFHSTIRLYYIEMLYGEPVFLKSCYLQLGPSSLLPNGNP